MTTLILLFVNSHRIGDAILKAMKSQHLVEVESQTGR